MTRRLSLLLVICCLTLVGCRSTQPQTPGLTEVIPPLMCTPPACQNGQTLVCPGDCPGGCGVVCANPVPAPGFAAAPTDWSGLESWLTAAWADRIDTAAVRHALIQTQRQTSAADWETADLDNDVRDDWILRLNTLAGEPDYADYGPVPTGRLWIVNGSGVVYRSETLPLVRVTRLIDLTGDGTEELVFEYTNLGASNAVTSYRVVSGSGGNFRNIVLPNSQSGEAAITMYNPDPIQFYDHDNDGRTDLAVHGGYDSAGGAGVIRESTQVWGWNGDTLALTATVLDPAVWRHHVLYEANDLFVAGDFANAILKYEAVINDQSLQTFSFDGNSAPVYADLSVFAAFRLISADLQTGNLSKAEQRLNWLQTTYPDRKITLYAAAQLLETWKATKSLEQACQVAEDALSNAINPTGTLTDMGYANPSLSAADLCP